MCFRNIIRKKRYLFKNALLFPLRIQYNVENQEKVQILVTSLFGTCWPRTSLTPSENASGQLNQARHPRWVGGWDLHLHNPRVSITTSRACTIQSSEHTVTGSADGVYGANNESTV